MQENLLIARVHTRLARELKHDEESVTDVAVSRRPFELACKPRVSV